MKYIKLLILTQFIVILIGPQIMCVYSFNNNNISKNNNNNNNQTLINNNNNNNDNDNNDEYKIDDKLFSSRSSTSSLTQLNQGLLSSQQFQQEQRGDNNQQIYQLYNNNNNSNNSINNNSNINYLNNNNSNYEGDFISTNSENNNNKANNNNNNNNNNQQDSNNYYLNTMGREIRGCQSCKIREQVKSDNLESIKRHILMRLELKQAPKIPPEKIIPPEIIEKFYKNHSDYGTSIINNNNNNNNSKLLNKNYGSMQNDDPNLYQQQQQNYTNNEQQQQQQQYHHHQHHHYNNEHHHNTYHNHYQYNNNNNSNSNNNNNNNGDDNDNIEYNNDDNNNDYYIQNNPLDNDGMDHYKEEFFSIINSIYVFPTISRMRHNRKPETLHFSLNNNGHSIVSQAILHFYIKGRNWIRNNERFVFENISSLNDDDNNDDDNDDDDDSILNNNNNNNNTINNNNYHQDIIISMNRIIRRQNSTHTQKIIESHYQIPNGDGQWYQLDVTDMVKNWYNNPNTNHGIVIKTLEGWMRPLVVTDDLPINKRYALYIEIQTKDTRKRRTKRNSSLNCNENDREERCCRYPLVVNFRDFDWDWIIAPSKFNAFFCNGECKLGFLQRYTHTHLMQLSTAAQPCCSPTKMSPISLLYFNNESNLVMSTIPNMSVDKCSCS